MEAQREPTTAGLLRLIRQREVRPTTTHTAALAPGVVNDLQELVKAAAKFSTIYADPPWPYSNQATRATTSNHYATMTVGEICDEPVEQLCDERAHLHLWTTNGFLLDAFDVIEAWGFSYKSCFIWVQPQIGIGNHWRVSHEFLLLGVRGRLASCQRSAGITIRHPLPFTGGRHRDVAVGAEESCVLSIFASAELTAPAWKR